MARWMHFFFFLCFSKSKRDWAQELKMSFWAKLAGADPGFGGVNQICASIVWFDPNCREGQQRSGLPAFNFVRLGLLKNRPTWARWLTSSVCFQEFWSQWPHSWRTSDKKAPSCQSKDSSLLAQFAQWICKRQRLRWCSEIVNVWIKLFEKQRNEVSILVWLSSASIKTFYLSPLSFLLSLVGFAVWVIWSCVFRSVKLSIELGRAAWFGFSKTKWVVLSHRIKGKNLPQGRIQKLLRERLKLGRNCFSDHGVRLTSGFQFLAMWSKIRSCR